MRVKTRFLCVDVPIGLGNGEIEIGDGTTVADAVTMCAKMYNMEMPLKDLLKSMFLVNSNPAQPDRVLNEGDELTVVRTMAGG
jgi:sulfur carrier protein ThiS